MSLKDKILKRIEVEVENFVKDNFKSESFAGRKWPARKSRDRSDRRNPDSPRKLLIKTSTLLRSIKVQRKGDSIVVSSNVPYAKIHNEGGTINHPGGTPYFVKPIDGKNKAVFMKKNGKYPKGIKFTKPHPIKIPQRKFVGDDQKLRDKLKKIIKEEFKAHLLSAFKNLK
jgi:phage gpG-like protein